MPQGLCSHLSLSAFTTLIWQGLCGYLALWTLLTDPSFDSTASLWSCGKWGWCKYYHASHRSKRTAPWTASRTSSSLALTPASVPVARGVHWKTACGWWIVSVSRGGGCNSSGCTYWHNTFLFLWTTQKIQLQEGPIRWCALRDRALSAGVRGKTWQTKFYYVSKPSKKYLFTKFFLCGWVFY